MTKSNNNKGGGKRLTSNDAYSKPPINLTKRINSKEKGARFEREVKKQLEQQGFMAIKQSASIFPDIIAISPGREIYLIECKVNKYLTKTEHKKLVENVYGNPFVAYPKYEGRKKYIAYLDLEKDSKLPESEKIYINELPI